MELTVTVGFITGIISFFIGYLAFMRNRDKDTRSDAQRDAVLETKLDMIAVGVETIKVDLKASDKRITELSEYVIRTDESVKQAHKRIDKIEVKIEH
ncbi:hypothetical protein ACIQ1D_19280 [Lysinibacillus xylanilyticus]|uniref:hypothetical protein n=1 Tax=Lysinibacillus xylanilyticus TaxID=582475 RepID=UPI0037F7B1EE